MTGHLLKQKYKDYMEQVSGLIRMLKIVFWTVVALPLLYVSVCLYAGLPGQTFAADRASSYVLDMAGVVATVALVPFALGYIGRRLGQKVQAEKSLPDAIRVYRLWSLVRMAVLFAVVSYNLVVYTLSSSDNSICILCAIIGFISYFLVMPTDRKVMSDLDIELND